MRVVIDGHVIGQRKTGNETYVVNLVRGLLSLDSIHSITLLVNHQDRVPPDLRGIRCQIQEYGISSPLWRLLKELPAAAKRRGVGVLHTLWWAPIKSMCPLVLTVHDVSFRRHPEILPLKDRVAALCLVPLSMHKATYIITISEYSKQEITTYYDIPAHKVVVTYLAPAPSFRNIDTRSPRIEEWLKAHRIRSPFVLTVGNLEPRKNLQRLFEAFCQVLGADSGEEKPQMVIVGKSYWRGHETKQIVESLGIGDHVRFTGYVSNEELNWLYNAASVFVYPSLYEGFGLPVVEAMACGTPVIASNTSSIPEVAGDAALLFDPYSVDGIAMALHKVLYEPGCAEFLKAAGLKRAGLFSWKNTARETVAVYQDAQARFSRNQLGG